MIQGVTDAKTLVTKYLNKEIVYGELLGKIADNEKTIERLKTETETLNQESKAQEMELEVLNSVRIKSQDLHGSPPLTQTTSRRWSRSTRSPRLPSDCRTAWRSGRCGS